MANIELGLRSAWHVITGMQSFHFLLYNYAFLLAQSDFRLLIFFMRSHCFCHQYCFSSIHIHLWCPLENQVFDPLPLTTCMRLTSLGDVHMPSTWNTHHSLKTELVLWSSGP